MKKAMKPDTMTIAMVMNDNHEKQLNNLFSWLSKVTPITMILNSGFMNDNYDGQRRARQNKSQRSSGTRTTKDEQIHQELLRHKKMNLRIIICLEKRKKLKK